MSWYKIENTHKYNHGLFFCFFVLRQRVNGILSILLYLPRNSHSSLHSNYITNKKLFYFTWHVLLVAFEDWLCFSWQRWEFLFLRHDRKIVDNRSSTSSSPQHNCYLSKKKDHWFFLTNLFSPWARYENPSPPGDFWWQWFLDTLLYDYSISACLHSKYWGIKKYWVIKHMHPREF